MSRYSPKICSYLKVKVSLFHVLISLFPFILSSPIFPPPLPQPPPSVDPENFSFIIMCTYMLTQH